MIEEKNNKIFELYNRKSDVVRCPYGRAIVREKLDSYAQAAVNLYGIISCSDFVNIFNEQNVDQTTEEEVYILLLPLVLKEGWYGFYKEYIVHYWVFEDIELADYLLKHQEDKPRYIPEKDEFLKYVNEYYNDNEGWMNVRRFMWDTFDNFKNASKGYEEIKDYITYDSGISELGSILDRHNLIFRSEDQFEEFINLIMFAKNNTRIWENNGYTPSELSEIFAERNKSNNIIKFPTVKKPKIGRNDPCPCGSGKKYKKCCAMVDDAKTAQLNSEECRLFYETWYGLMGFVNEQKRIIKAKIKPEYPNDVSDVIIHKVREVLWEKPELIDEYINKAELSQEKIDILKLWRMKHKKGMFLVLEYQPEYAVVIAPNEQGEDRLYGIKGMSNSLANILRQDLPVMIETVLIPFKGKIIYDSYIGTFPIGYAKGAKALFGEMHAKAAEHGIITSLE